ncbi:hypothetical protein H0H81_004064 [Sphagnurus paluster]|uniref:HMG box domain-containing protein n=1 Tax=Sphagnurus paluster TaxID=117069 RepID=A0A9P7K6X1_9AGAR|nr:hypothetical protein H0H81_004064 [Sphagnurus paluster]
MAEEITKFDQERAKFEEGLGALAKTLRHAADQAESFYNFVKGTQFNHGFDDVSDKKGRKRKAGAVDDSDDKPTKRKRKPKDPNAPKRPASSYIMFQNDIRKDLKEKNPNITNAELLALIAKKWGEMSEADKEVYNKAVANAKEQYSNEKKAYDARSPEEVAAANAASEAAIAAKKAQPRARKAAAAAPSVPAPAPVPAASSPSVGSSDEEDSEESDEEQPQRKKQAVSDSSEEDEEEEEEEEPVKPVSRKKNSKAVPAPQLAKKKKTTK